MQPATLNYSCDCELAQLEHSNLIANHAGARLIANHASLHSTLLLYLRHVLFYFYINYEKEAYI